MYIRIQVGGKSPKKSIGIVCKEKNFDVNAKNFKYISKHDTNHEVKNRAIKNEYERIEKKLIDLHGEGIILTPDLAREVLGVKERGNSIYQTACEKIATNTSRTEKRYSIMANTHLKGDFGHVPITQLNSLWLHSFEAYLKQYKHLGALYAPNTIHGILKFIRAVVNFAIDKKGIEMEYPFGRRPKEYKIPKYKQPKRNHLTTDELEKIKAYRNSEDPMIRNTVRWFVFQAYSGFRWSDLPGFTLSQVRGGKLYLTDVKEKSPHYIPMYAELKEAISMLDKPVYAYDVMNRTLKSLGAVIGIPFKLTTHVGRHTFAVHYLDMGGSMEVLQKLFGHADIRTTQIYGEVTSRKVDTEMKKVRG